MSVKGKMQIMFPRLPVHSKLGSNSVKAEGHKRDMGHASIVTLLYWSL